MAFELLEQNLTTRLAITADSAITTPPWDVLSSSGSEGMVTGNAVDTNLTLLQSVFVGMLLTSLAIGTVIGNLLVILSVCLDRHLHSPPNVLIVNLAVADLMVGLLVMPFSIAELVGRPWIWVQFLCDVYINFDVLCCTASIVNLCMISVDRYLAITRPFKYAPKRTYPLMFLMVFIVWVIGAFIALSAHIWGGNIHTDNVCLLSQDTVYTIYSTFGAFYLPLVIMLTVYYKVYRAAKRMEKLEMSRRPSVLPNSRRSSENSDDLDTSRRKSILKLTDYVKNKARPSVVSVKIAKGKRRISLRGERKAAKTLGVIMGGFTLCWLPFFLLASVRPFLKFDIPPMLDILLLWLGYVNSVVNPVIYPLFNKDFGPAYKRLLSCKCIGGGGYAKRRRTLYNKRLSNSSSPGHQNVIVRIQKDKQDSDSEDGHDEYGNLTATDLLNGNVVNRRPSDLDKIPEASDESGCEV